MTDERPDGPCDEAPESDRHGHEQASDEAEHDEGQHQREQQEQEREQAGNDGAHLDEHDPAADDPGGDVALGVVPRRRAYQLTADRVKARTATAVSSAVNATTTARLSQASVVVLLMPQMSCRPVPRGSTSP